MAKILITDTTSIRRHPLTLNLVSQRISSWAVTWRLMTSLASFVVDNWSQHVPLRWNVLSNMYDIPDSWGTVKSIRWQRFSAKCNLGCNLYFIPGLCLCMCNHGEGDCRGFLPQPTYQIYRTVDSASELTLLPYSPMQEGWSSQCPHKGY